MVLFFLFIFFSFPFKFKNIYLNEMYFGIMPSLSSIDIEIWVKHFWLSWEHSGCLKGEGLQLLILPFWNLFKV